MVHLNILSFFPEFAELFLEFNNALQNCRAWNWKKNVNKHWIGCNHHELVRFPTVLAVILVLKCTNHFVIFLGSYFDSASQNKATKTFFVMIRFSEDFTIQIDFFWGFWIIESGLNWVQNKIKRRGWNVQPPSHEKKLTSD